MRLHQVVNLAYWQDRAEKAEAALDEAIKQIATMSEEMGKVEAEREKLRKALQALYDAEWMVTHDWGGDRDSVMDKVRKALNIDPETNEPRALLAEIDAAAGGEGAGE